MLLMSITIWIISLYSVPAQALNVLDFSGLSHLTFFTFHSSLSVHFSLFFPLQNKHSPLQFYIYNIIDKFLCKSGGNRLFFFYDSDPGQFSPLSFAEINFSFTFKLIFSSRTLSHIVCEKIENFSFYHFIGY